MLLKSILTGTVCLCVGVAVGRLTADAESGSSARSVTVAKSVEREHLTHHKIVPHYQRTENDIELLHRVSGVEQTSEAGPLVVVPAALIQQLKNNHGTRSLGHDLFTSDDEAESLLQISDQEKATLQKAWRGMKQRLLHIESGLVKVEDLEDGSVRLTVPDFAADVAAVTDSFRWQANTTLGENRAEVFLAMKQFDSMLSQMTGEQVYLVEMDAVGDGQWRYRIQQKRDDKAQSLIVTRTIPTHLRHLTERVGIQTSLD